MATTFETEIDFCARREAEERAAADAAACGASYDVHFSMAERYADRAWSIGEAVTS